MSKPLNYFFGWFVAAYLLVGVHWCSSLHAQESAYYKVDELIKLGKEMDGKEVIIQGEVIGDIMPRQKGYLWFNLQDSTGVMGVWVQGVLAREIIVAGDYNYHGDLVEVSGVFARADRELGGETCLRAQSIDILKHGHKIEHALNPIKIKIAAVLAVLAGILLFLRLIIQRRT